MLQIQKKIENLSKKLKPKSQNRQKVLKFGKPYLKHKKNFTLVELLISLSLTAIIASLLITFSFRLFWMQRKIKIAKQEFLAEAALEVKLRSLFTDVLEKSKNHFYTDSTGARLFFIYDRKADTDPLFSGLLKAELFLDKKNNLVLISRLFSEKNQKKEILAKDIENLKFVFFKQTAMQNSEDSAFLKTSFWQKKELPDIWQAKLYKKWIYNHPLEKKGKKMPYLKLMFFSDTNSKLSLWQKK